MLTDIDSFITFALCFSGMAALGLAMERHHTQATADPAPPGPMRCLALRAAGSMLLAASLYTCLAGWGPTVGFIAWWAYLTAGALAVVVSLSYRPRWTPRAALLGAMLALAALPAVT